MPAEPAPDSGFRRCGVVGAGTMGTGIAQALAAAGAEVWLVEPAVAQRERARATLSDRLPEAARVSWVGDPGGLPAGLDLVVESVPERLELKQRVLVALESREPGLLGSNTSGLSITELASGLQHPERLLGLHFFNPVRSSQLLEVIRTDAALPELVLTARRLAGWLGKIAVVVADRPGFATTRLGVLLGLEAIRMLADGVADAGAIDQAMELGYRHPMGPLRLTDLIGLDVRLDIARHLRRSYGDRFDPPQLLIDKVTRGELGRKTGRGFYDWSVSPARPL